MRDKKYWLLKLEVEEISMNKVIGDCYCYIKLNNQIVDVLNEMQNYCFLILKKNDIITLNFKNLNSKKDLCEEIKIEGNLIFCDFAQFNKK